MLDVDSIYPCRKFINFDYSYGTWYKEKRRKNTFSPLEAYLVCLRQKSLMYSWSQRKVFLKQTLSILETYLKHTWSRLEAYLKQTWGILDPPLASLTPLDPLDLLDPFGQLDPLGSLEPLKPPWPHWLPLPPWPPRLPLSILANI